ncbi:MAG: hypothetical protein ACE5JI_02870, partial [Acidobacteriota bacterium]
MRSVPIACVLALTASAPAHAGPDELPSVESILRRSLEKAKQIGEQNPDAQYRFRMLSRTEKLDTN